MSARVRHSSGWSLHHPGRVALSEASPDAARLWRMLTSICLARLLVDPLATVTDDVLTRAATALQLADVDRLVDELVACRLLRPADPTIPDVDPPRLELRAPAVVFELGGAPAVRTVGITLVGRWVPGPLAGWELAGSPSAVLSEFIGRLQLPAIEAEERQLEVRRDVDGAGWLYRTGAWS